MENLHVEKKDNIYILKLTGELTLDVTPALKQKIEELYSQDSFDGLIFDLSGIHFMDSSGIGFLVALNTRLQRGGGKLYLYKPTDQVKKTLELVQLISVFQLLESDDDMASVLSG